MKSGAAQRLNTCFLKAHRVCVLPALLVPLGPLPRLRWPSNPSPPTCLLHLEEHLDDATIIGSEVPADLPQPVEWRFDEPQPGWKATTPRPFPAGIRPATVSQTDDALQITLGPSNANASNEPVGGVFVDVPEWNHRDWAHVVIRARSSGPGDMALGFNVWDREGHPDEGWPYPYEMRGGVTAPHSLWLVTARYRRTSCRWSPKSRGKAPVRASSALERIGTGEPLTVEILSITVVPMAAVFAEEPAGIRHVEGQPVPALPLRTHSGSARVPCTGA